MAKDLPPVQKFYLWRAYLGGVVRVRLAYRGVDNALTMLALDPGPTKDAPRITVTKYSCGGVIAANMREIDPQEAGVILAALHEDMLQTDPKDRDYWNSDAAKLVASAHALLTVAAKIAEKDADHE